VVYDFGIRENPEFGMEIAKKYPQCEVHGFDPSPVSVAWWKSFKSSAVELRALPNYHFHGYGAGGKDGTVALYDYNWGQVRVHACERAPSCFPFMCVTASNYPSHTPRCHCHCHCHCLYR
jgi:hypothetical protein